ncbi:hypothetical protein AB434_4085 [Heyndrickxia coagulans]|nr:hypothetical protein AB434_4085 [Heyndrickxia coagulans]
MRRRSGAFSVNRRKAGGKREWQQEKRQSVDINRRFWGRAFAGRPGN